MLSKLRIFTILMNKYNKNSKYISTLTIKSKHNNDKVKIKNIKIPNLISQRYKYLIDKINKMDNLYYDTNSINAETISDLEYDGLLSELKSIELKYKAIIIENSPTYKIGSNKDTTYNTFKNTRQHITPMLSLDNGNTIKDIITFHNNNINLLSKYDTTKSLKYLCEWKYDGLALSLIYENGNLKYCLTRGDGISGEDITHSILQLVPNLPKKLTGEFSNGIVEVRGEVYMTHEEFKKLKDLKDIISPRNACVGLVRSNSESLVDSATLNFVAYSLSKNIDNFYTSNLNALNYLGFYAGWNQELILPTGENNLAVIEKLISDFVEIKTQDREKINFDADGIVLKIDNLIFREKLGYTTRAPRWAIAFKFAPQKAITTLESVILQTGRSGKITPVANLSPINLKGSLIKRATLYNIKHVIDKGYRVNDKVLIERAGDVIPTVSKIVKSGNGKLVLDDLNLENIPANTPIYPGFMVTSLKCPCSKSQPLFEKIGSPDYFCKYLKCTDIVLGKLQYFCSIDGLNIVGLGEESLSVLLKQGLVSIWSDLFKLNEPTKLNSLKSMPGWGEKKVSKIISSIETAKLPLLVNFLAALGIPNLGKDSCSLLLTKYKTIDELYNAKYDDLCKIEGLGPVSSKSVIDYLEANPNLLNEIKTAGISFQNETSKKLSIIPKFDIFKGKLCVLTGKFRYRTREEWRDCIKVSDGELTNSVNSKTTLLLVGADTKSSSKLDTAKENKNITIVHEGTLIPKL